MLRTTTEPLDFWTKKADRRVICKTQCGFNRNSDLACGWLLVARRRHRLCWPGKKAQGNKIVTICRYYARASEAIPRCYPTGEPLMKSESIQRFMSMAALAIGLGASQYAAAADITGAGATFPYP